MAMPSTNPVEANRKTFTLEQANKMLPLVRAIVTDIVKQNQIVVELKTRLTGLKGDRRKSTDDVYSEELAHSRSILDSEEDTLRNYLDELVKLGVEPKGLDDGLCDFPSIKNGQPIYLCWRLGEPEVAHWHELDSGFKGRQPIELSQLRFE
jgi:hypothetical protein